ncbi:MAG: hypothetical protein Q4E33_01700 [Erysipelotrichaceae bacterium]|nr:hypothetical protein [Erysipelotrichaceae bacterium]
MSEKLFREKSLKRISSPEELNDYLKVTSPSIWILLTSVIVLLVGALVWATFGTMDTTINTVAVNTEGNVIRLYVKEDDISKIEVGQTVKINDEEYKIDEIRKDPISVDGTFPDYVLHVGNIQIGEWVYTLIINANIEPGVYEAKIVVESIKPINLLFN